MAETNCVICGCEVDIESENKVTYNGNEYPICWRCNGKIEKNIEANAIFSTERGQLLNKLVDSVFEYIYEIFNNNYSCELNYQPTIENIQDTDFVSNEEKEEIYSETEDFKSIKEEIGVLSADDIEMIEKIWEKVDEDYYNDNRSELSYRSTYDRGEDRSGKLGYQEKEAFIELLKKEFNYEDEED